jgi:hypothetical protein
MVFMANLSHIIERWSSMTQPTQPKHISIFDTEISGPPTAAQAKQQPQIVQPTPQPTPPALTLQAEAKA